MVNGTMLTFLKILFFGSWVTITQTPIDIGSIPVQINLDEPISAITSGAHLRIDITSHIESSNITAQLDEAKKFMSEGCLTAQLITSENKTYLLDHLYRSVGNGTMELALTKKGGVPTDIDFSAIVVTSCKPIESTIIKWVNYKK